MATGRTSGSHRLRRTAERRASLGGQAREEREVVRAHERAANRHHDSFLAHLNLKPVWLALAVLAMAAVALMPGLQDLGLSVAGQRALAVLAFAVIV
ncbi:hypothetical protein [Micrococcus sp. NPDC055215]